MSDHLTDAELDDARTKLVRLAEWCLSEAREYNIGDIDGGSFQDKCEELGVLVTVTVTEPCGENCRCAEYYGEFPVECFRYPTPIQRLIDEIKELRARGRK